MVGTLSEVGGMAPDGGEEHSECSNAKKKPQFPIRGANPKVLGNVKH